MNVRLAQALADQEAHAAGVDTKNDGATQDTFVPAAGILAQPEVELAGIETTRARLKNKGTMRYILTITKANTTVANVAAARCTYAYPKADELCDYQTFDLRMGRRYRPLGSNRV